MGMKPRFHPFELFSQNLALAGRCLHWRDLFQLIGKSAAIQSVLQLHSKPGHYSNLSWLAASLLKLRGLPPAAGS